MNKIERKLHKIDATGLTIGRMATKIATLLRGKNKPEYEPHIDGGDIVEVYHLDKVKVTGKKMEQKELIHYSGHLGGLKRRQLKDVMAKNPKEVLVTAVKEMLPATKLRPAMLKRLIIR